MAVYMQLTGVPEGSPLSAPPQPATAASPLITFFRLVRNEIEKTWRSRWIVFAVLFGIFVLIAGGLYTFYVVREHRWTPPPPVAWQAQLGDESCACRQSAC